MSNFLKPMGVLTMVAASVGGAGYSSEVNSQGVNVTATVKDERPVQLPRPPLKIPMPLDKAGYKIDVTFEVPHSSNGMTYLDNLIGLRVLFTPGVSDVRIALENHPVKVRIALYRIENSKEVSIPLLNRKLISGFGEHPRRYEVRELPEGKATASRSYTEHSGAPRGTPDASTIVMSFAGAGTAVTPGIYRFQIETSEDIPELRGVTSFFVYEEPLKR